MGLPPALQGLDRCLVMGVLNVTADSFSDGGLHLDPEAAIAAGVALAAAGADLVDVGGESTRPGAQRIEADEELRRVLPVVGALAQAGVPVSIDTMRAETAAACLEAGAVLINDVSGGLADPQMLPWLATVAAPYVAMHWRGPSARMDELARYDDVVGDVVAELAARLVACEAAGVDPQRVVVDPGLGFAKQADHNWALLAALGRLRALGRPVLVGASRKRFLGSLLAGTDGEPRPVDDRDRATDAVTAVAASSGAWCVRVHDARSAADAVRTAAALSRFAVAEPPRSGPATANRDLGGGSERIELAGIRGYGRHGWFAFETEQGQEFAVDVVLELDLGPAAASDDLADTLDYGAVGQQVVALIEGEPHRLIETLAARIAEACLGDARVRRASVTVHKPEAPMPVPFGDVAVTAVRERG